MAPRLISILPARGVTGKKLVATFRVNGRIKKVRFGATGYSDYTVHKDDRRKQAYIARHKTGENWDDPLTAGALSRWVLWNKPTLAASIRDYRERFGL